MGRRPDPSVSDPDRFVGLIPTSRSAINKPVQLLYQAVAVPINQHVVPINQRCPVRLDLDGRGRQGERREKSYQQGKTADAGRRTTTALVPQVGRPGWSLTSISEAIRKMCESANSGGFRGWSAESWTAH